MAAAELLVLGSGTGLPNVKRNPPGYLLSVERKNLLLDSGSGTLQRLINRGITYQDIDYILYTHLHPDHTLDFASILFAARNPRDIRKKELAVIGPRHLEDFYNRLLSLYGKTIKPESYRLTFKEMKDNDLKLEYLRISTKPLDHTDASVGFRIELKDKKSIVYSGDTDYCENIVGLSKDCDLLMLECSFPDEFRTKGHLTPSLAGKIAAKAHAKRLILTHLYPVCDEYPILRQCRKHFNGRVSLARDYMKIRL